MNKRGNIHIESIAVTAVGGGVGQSVLRALRLSDLPLRIIGLDANPWGAGLYACQSGYLVPLAHDASYIERLLQVLVREQVRVLIPGCDPELSVLAVARERILSAGILPILGSVEAIDLCRNKLAAAHYFRKHGLPFAYTVPAHEGFRLAEEVGYPLIIKPIGGSASRDVAVAFNEVQLRQYVDQDWKIIQEYLVPESWKKTGQDLTMRDVIQGGILRQTDEISIQILFDHEGQLMGQFTSRNVLRDGVPLLIDPWPNAAAEEIAYKMASMLVSLGLIGPCNFQCKLTDRGPIFFEINPRFTGITAVRAAMGFNEVDAVLRRALLHESIHSVRNRLQVPENLVCSRYITEMVISRAELGEIQKHDCVAGHGYRTNM